MRIGADIGRQTASMIGARSLDTGSLLDGRLTDPTASWAGVPGIDFGAGSSGYQTSYDYVSRPDTSLNRYFVNPTDDAFFGPGNGQGIEVRSTDRYVGTSNIAASHTTTVTLPGVSVSVSTGPGVSLWDTVTLQSTVSSTRAAMIAADRPRGPAQVVLPPIEQGAKTGVRRRADQSPIDTGGLHADVLSRADLDLDYRVDDALGRQPSVYDAYAGQSAGNAERAWAGQLSAYAGRNGFAQPANDWSPAQMHGYYEILEGANHPDLYSAADLRVKAQAYADRVNDINIGNDPQRLRQVFENEDRVLLTEYSALAAGGAVGAPAAVLTGALTTSLGGGFLATGAGLAIDGAIGDAMSQFVKMGAYHATGGVAGQRDFAYGELAGSAALPLVPLLATRGSSLLAYGARSAWGKVTAYGKMLGEFQASRIGGEVGATGSVGDAGLRIVGGKLPINSRYAGRTYPLEKLPPDLQAKYPESVFFSVEGFPDFSPYSVAKVQIRELTGVYATDAALANQAVGLKATPESYVWHHVEDGETMLLIPRDIHNAVRHTGGAAVIRCGR